MEHIRSSSFNAYSTYKKVMYVLKFSTRMINTKGFFRSTHQSFFFFMYKIENNLQTGCMNKDKTKEANGSEC